MKRLKYTTDLKTFLSIGEGIPVCQGNNAEKN
jgi:hypothetical protein